MSWKRGGTATMKCCRCSAQWTIIIGDAKQNLASMTEHSLEPCIGCVEVGFPDCPDDE